MRLPDQREQTWHMSQSTGGARLIRRRRRIQQGFTLSKALDRLMRIAAAAASESRIFCTAETARWGSLNSDMTVCDGCIKCEIPHGMTSDSAIHQSINRVRHTQGAKEIRHRAELGLADPNTNLHWREGRVTKNITKIAINGWNSCIRQNPPRSILYGIPSDPGEEVFVCRSVLRNVARSGGGKAGHREALS